MAESSMFVIDPDASSANAASDDIARSTAAPAAITNFFISISPEKENTTYPTSRVARTGAAISTPDSGRLLGRIVVRRWPDGGRRTQSARGKLDLLKRQAAAPDDAAAAHPSEAYDQDEAGVTAVAVILPSASLLYSIFTFSPTCSEAASMLAGRP